MENKTYHVGMLPGEPIILFKAYKGFSVVNDQPHSDAESYQLLDESSEPLYLITDLSDFVFTLDDIILGTNTGARGQSPVWKHPNIQELLLVTKSAVINLAGKGLDSMAFGNIKVKSFHTQEDALAYCRAKIAGGKKTNPH